MKIFSGLFVVVLTVYLPTVSQAAITFTNLTADGGTGFGNVANLLSLQNTPTEWGSIIWNGSADEQVNPGEVANTSKTWLIADLITKFGNSNYEDWGLILNLNQTGNSPNVSVHDFNLIVFNGDGTTAGTLMFSGDLSLSVAGQGSGTSGWLFDVDGLSALITSPSTQRLGMSVLQSEAFQTTDDGPDNFYLGDFPDGSGQFPVPEPATFAIWSLGLMGVGLVARRRRNLLAK